MEKEVRKLHLKDGDELDIQYWKNKSPEEKLDILQYLREVYFEFKNESRKGFQRVYRVIKQK
jgi:predicted solute-binding protein